MKGVCTLRDRAVLSTDKEIRSAMVLVISADGDVLHFVDWRRALLMVHVGHAYVVETVKTAGDDGTLRDVVLRSPSVEVPLPLIVALTPGVYVPDIAFASAKTETAQRLAVLRRDKFTCTYCGGRGATVDHIFPKSRGGRYTWQNLVTACADCNVAKSDRTPEEAGMTMLFDPRVFEGGAEDLQAEVWERIDAATSA